MTQRRAKDTRTALVEAAADLVSAAPGQEVPLRAVCDRVGVKLPTLYHHFGSKEGLLDAVVEVGFDRYLALKEGTESTGDPIEDIRAGWDAHVRFGVQNAGFYALMYGKVVPGHRPAAQQRATTLLRRITALAHEHGRLVVDPDAAADQVLAANVGTTLQLITAEEPDWPLSAAVRDATLAAVTGERTVQAGSTQHRVVHAATGLLRAMAAEPDGTSPLDEPEQVLLRKWLALITRPPPASPSDTPTASDAPTVTPPRKAHPA